MINQGRPKIENLKAQRRDNEAGISYEIKSG
jgi:hypothetical protein